MKIFIPLLQKNQDVHAWALTSLRKQSNELYVTGGRTETYRCNTVLEYALTVHTKTNDPAYIGESITRFQPMPGQSKRIVGDAVERAALVRNRKYQFSDPWQLPKIKNPIYDESFKRPAADILHEMAESILSLTDKDLGKCTLASFELFLEEFDFELVNHKGHVLQMPSTRILWDYVLTSPDNAHEINVFTRRRFLEHLPLTEILRKESAYLNDMMSAELPPTGNYAVILADEALDNLFDFFTAQTDGSALYNKYSVFEKDHTVYQDGAAREPLTLKSDPFMQGGMNSHFFDAGGFPMKPLTLIENGMVKEFSIDGRHSDLLNMPRTSAQSNIVVEPGKTKYADFQTHGVLELLRFSTFQPNVVSGAFSGEIRLGYLHKNGQKIPVKGGSVSGITQVAFQKALFSRETEQRGAYLGPRGMYFENLTIAGE